MQIPCSIFLIKKANLGLSKTVKTRICQSKNDAAKKHTEISFSVKAYKRMIPAKMAPVSSPLDTLSYIRNDG